VAVCGPWWISPRGRGDFPSRLWESLVRYCVMAERKPILPIEELEEAAMRAGRLNEEKRVTPLVGVAPAAIQRAVEFLSPEAITGAIVDHDYSVQEEVRTTLEIVRDPKQPAATRLSAMEHVRRRIVDALRLSGQLATITAQQTQEVGEDGGVGSRMLQTISTQQVLPGMQASEAALRGLRVLDTDSPRPPKETTDDPAEQRAAPDVRARDESEPPGLPAEVPSARPEGAPALLPGLAAGRPPAPAGAGDAARPAAPGRVSAAPAPDDAAGECGEG